MRKFISLMTAMLVSLVFGIGFMSAAHAQSADQLLASPKVDDIYAARLDHFSEYSFGAEGGAAYGLLRVIRVTDAEVVVVTEDAAWPEKKGALDDLKGDFSDITWDFDEEISIKRSELASLKRQGLILNARRLSPAQIKEYLN